MSRESKNFYAILLGLLVSFSGLRLSANDTYRLSSPPYNPGMFSVFHTVLGALNFYDSGLCSGLTVNFGKQGLYYDKNHGLNWWDYYFKPIHLGTQKKDVKAFTQDEMVNFAMQAQYKMPRMKKQELIQKYIIIKAHIEKKIEKFIQEKFKKNFMIGIHYRGTDKLSEASAVSYAHVHKTIEEIEKPKKWKLFVATDDARFIEYMHKKFPSKILTIDALRSKNGQPVHYAERVKNYKKGEDALLDSILLSRCDILVKMASNLSDASMSFNPQLPVMHLNKAFAAPQGYYDGTTS